MYGCKDIYLCVHVCILLSLHALTTLVIYRENMNVYVSVTLVSESVSIGVFVVMTRDVYACIPARTYRSVL